eukprot:PhF_6_TR9231/c1_g1_i5/m.14542
MENAENESEFNGTPYEHYMSTMCEMDEIFSLYCQNPNTVVATIGLVLFDSNPITSIPMDTMPCVLSFASLSPAPNQPPKRFTIILKTLQGLSHSIEVPRNCDVETLKIIVQEKMNIPTDSQRLIFQGMILQDDDRTLDHYNIGNGSMLVVMKRSHRDVIEGDGDGHLYPTKLILPENLNNPPIFRVTDCFGDVPFEQCVGVLTLGRPTVNPTVALREGVHIHVRNPIIRMKILRNDEKSDDDAVSAETKTPHHKGLPCPLDKGGLAVHFRSVAAEALGITPLQCILHIQMQSSVFVEVKCSQDLIHPAATNTFLVKVLPYRVMISEVLMDCQHPVLHSRYGMVVPAMVRGMQVYARHVSNDVVAEYPIYGVMVNDEGTEVFQFVKYVVDE